MEDRRRLGANFDANIDSVDRGSATCLSTTSRFETGGRVSMPDKVTALSNYLAVLDSRMSGVENHLAQMEQRTQQSLQGIEALLRAALQNTTTSTLSAYTIPPDT